MESAANDGGSSPEPEYGVVWPLGRRAADESPIPPAIPDLDGKTVAFLWDNLFRGDEMFDLIADELKERYPSIRFVGWETFGNVHGANEIELLEELPGRLHELDVDAAVVAVAA
jgi:hypothetical protein